MTLGVVMVPWSKGLSLAKGLAEGLAEGSSLAKGLAKGLAEGSSLA